MKEHGEGSPEGHREWFAQRSIEPTLDIAGPAVTFRERKAARCKASRALLFQLTGPHVTGRGWQTFVPDMGRAGASFTGRGGGRHVYRRGSDVVRIKVMNRAGAPRIGIACKTIEAPPAGKLANPRAMLRSPIPLGLTRSIGKLSTTTFIQPKGRRTARRSFA